jgi:hypothetical protein
MKTLIKIRYLVLEVSWLKIQNLRGPSNQIRSAS